MFYKVIYNNKVIDVLDGLVYLKYQKKHNRMIFCDKSEAQGIFSSDKEHIWHIEGLFDIPVPGYETVQLEEIDEYEYKQLKVLDTNTPENIRVVDMFVMALVNKEVGQLVQSLKRLYERQAIDRESVIEFCKRNEIANDVRNYILEEGE